MENEEKINVLIVDDNPAKILSIESVISDLKNLNIVKANSGREALRMLLNQNFAVILLDVKMPEMDGFETAELIRKRERTKHMPIIFITATSEDEIEKIKGYSIGASDYIFTPVIPEILRAKVSVFSELFRLNMQLKKQAEELEITKLLQKEIVKRKEKEEEALHLAENLKKTNKQLEDALLKLKLLQNQTIQQERLQAMGQMASGIAHDFNNALTPILGFSEILLMKPEILNDKEKVKNYLQMINTSSQDAANVVSRLREFYRNREETEVLQPIILKQLLEQVVNFTKPKWEGQAQSKGINIKIMTELRKVPLIYGIETELREILINLIFNSVDAMQEDGEITIRTYQKDEYSVIEISDTGVGMTEEVKNRAFEPFFTTKKDTGTGLGLSMVYGVIQRHQGKIEVKSEVNKGTTIFIYLPITEQKIEEEKKVEDTTFRKLNILLVDDRQDVRKTIAEYLRIDEHNILEAENGRDGFEKFKKGKFDLVITDKAMPELSGDQLAQMIKKISPLTPVIMLTGFGNMMEEKDEKPEGVDLILSKPVTIDKLKAGISQVMNSLKK